MKLALINSLTIIIVFVFSIVTPGIGHDVVDKELGAMRKERWGRAFGSTSTVDTTFSTESVNDRNNRKATIVLEHMIPASDICHTQQHWQISTNLNEELRPM